MNIENRYKLIHAYTSAEEKPDGSFFVSPWWLRGGSLLGLCKIKNLFYACFYSFSTEAEADQCAQNLGGEVIFLPESMDDTRDNLIEFLRRKFS